MNEKITIKLAGNRFKKVVLILVLLFAPTYTIPVNAQAEVSDLFSTGTEHGPVEDYANLIAAVSAADEWDTILIGGDIAFTKHLEINKSLKFRVAGNAETCQFLMDASFNAKPGNGDLYYMWRHIWVNAPGKDVVLEFDNIHIIGRDTTEGFDEGHNAIDSTKYGGGIWTETGTTSLTLINAVIKFCYNWNNNSRGGAIGCSWFKGEVTNGSYTDRNLIIKGEKTEISYNSSQRGGGIMGNHVTIEAGTIKNNWAVQYGGGVYPFHGLTMTGGTVTGNKANMYGGGFASHYWGSYTITGGMISSNEAIYGGGGIYHYTDYYGDTTKMTAAIIAGNVQIVNNTADSGGGIYGYNIRVEGGTIDKNTANNGAGLYGDNLVSVSGGLITGNHAKADGGGIYGFTEINVSGGMITKNTALNGGGISGVNISFDYSNIAYNTTTRIELSGNAKIMENTADNSGGGIYIYNNGESLVAGSTANLIVSGGEISGNTAINGGGIYCGKNANETNSCNVNVSDAVISGNRAATDGGGIWMYDLTALSTSGTVFSSNKASVGYGWTVNRESDNTVIQNASGVHHTNITDTAYTLPFANAYSNYDVNFHHENGETATCYTVTFYSNYEAGDQFSMVFEADNLITGQPVLTRPGYIFGGWYKDKENTSTWDFSSETVTDDVNLYALWTLVSNHIEPSETAPGIIPEVTPDVTSETTSEIPPETNSETNSEAASEIIPDVSPETTPETNSEMIPEASPETIPGVVPDIPPDVPPGYENVPQEDGSYDVEDTSGNQIGNWNKNKDNNDWVFNPGNPPVDHLVPQEDGSYEVVTPDGTTDGLWSKNENDDWVYEDYTPENNTWVIILISSLTLLGLLTGLYFLVFARRYVTRGEFVRMVVRAVDLKTEIGEIKPYSDVPEDSDYYEVIMTAKTEGLLSGFTESEFHPDTAITREEMSSVLAGTVRYADIPMPTDYLDLSASLKDFDKIDILFIEDVRFVSQLGIMRQRSYSKFDPKGLSYRRQASKIVELLMDVVSPHLNQTE